MRAWRDVSSCVTTKALSSLETEARRYFLRVPGPAGSQEQGGYCGKCPGGKASLNLPSATKVTQPPACRGKGPTELTDSVFCGAHGRACAQGRSLHTTNCACGLCAHTPTSEHPVRAGRRGEGHRWGEGHRPWGEGRRKGGWPHGQSVGTPLQLWLILLPGPHCLHLWTEGSL